MARRKKQPNQQQPTISTTAKRRWFRELSDEPLVKTGALLLAVFLAGMAAQHFLIDRNVDAELANALATWEFASPLYQKIPGDVDFIARGIRIDREQGSQTVIHIPNGDVFNLQISELRPTQNGEYEIAFGMVGKMGSNQIVNPVSRNARQRIPVAPNVVSPPIGAFTHEFFVHIDKVAIDYITVSVARRPLPELADIGTFQGLSLQGFAGPTYVGPRPQPILRTTRDERRRIK